MDRKDFIREGRKRYRKFYRMVALATAISVAVISGSLIIGDSVRKSLQKRVEDRLFGMKSVVVSADGFLGSEALAELSLGEESRGILLSDGFVSRGGRLYPVMVWGMDALPDGSPIGYGEAVLNAELQEDLGDMTDPTVVLRLPSDGLVPSSSLFVTSRYSTSLRLEYKGSLDASHGGNLSLRNGQVIPYNVFVSREELCESLGVGDKVNVILSPGDIRKENLSSLSPSALGIRMEDGRITSDGVFLKKDLVDKLYSSIDNPDRLFSYLVNSIDVGGKSIPYSFATAADRFDGKPIPENGAILSDYAAKRLGAGKGDKVEVTYFVSDDLKNLSEKTKSFTVTDIVPIEKFTEDGHLSADFPGLADAESCSSWDSDLPIDMDKISDEDEDYWTDYKSTPKILLPYAVMREEWSDSWGDATQIRTTSSPSEILSRIGAEDFPVSVVQPYDEAMENAVSGVDFGGLFLALGCFIVIAALFLLYSPLGEMYALRREELSLLGSIGFGKKEVSALLRREVLPVACIGSLAGSVLAVLYAGGVIFLLGNIWSGATQTDGFTLYPRPLTVAAGFLAGFILSYAVIAYAIKKASFDKVRAKETPAPGKLPVFISAAVLLMAVVAGILNGPSVIWFIIIGSLFLLFGILLARYFFGKGDPSGETSEAVKRQGIRHSLPEVTTGLITLALGVFITFAVGLNRKDFSNLRALEGGTGGFDLWCELTVPLQHDISNAEGKKKMNLQDLGEDSQVMQLTLVGGDDASCLNLNRITTPAILGFREGDFLGSKFRIKENIFGLKDDAAVLERMASDRETDYCLVDETVLMWGLMLSVGDTLHYSGPSGETIDVVIAGSLPNTVFQGYALMPQSVLERHWNDRGSRIILASSSNKGAATLLETALNEYGIRAIGANERLKRLGTVTDTYLTIFMMLGAVGLLLGIVSFALGVRKRLQTKKKDILLLRSLGFTDSGISSLLKKENTPAPTVAVLLGLFAAVLSVVVSFGAISLWTWITCLATTVLCIVLLNLSVGKMAGETVSLTDEKDEDTDN
ncbi:MAG: FtsX-like permease family protein [Bacteroidales bacterium]|nr:FtsX-like permease family protein [Bacteroidales bacterium]